MPQIINTNIASLNAQRNLNSSQAAMSTALQRLSSGLRINSAKDDAAGLSIASRMTAQISGLNQAARNANDGISMAQTAEGALGTISDNLQRMRELSVQAANGTNSASDRTALQSEISQLQQEITRVATTTSFNGTNLLDGTLANATFQVGANANQTISISMTSVQATSIGSNDKTATGVLNNAAVTAAGAGAKVANSMTANPNLTISGSAGTVSTGALGIGATGYTIAAAVNAQTASTNVSATAVTEATLSGLTATGNITVTLFGSNATGVAVSANVTSTSDLSSLASAINNVAASTGINATISGGTITLRQEQGYDIGLTDFTSAGNINLQGLDANSHATAGAARTLIGTTAATDSSTVGATVKFSSSSAFTVTDSAGGAAGLFAASTAQASALSAVASISVGSVNGATSALSVIDGALSAVNSLRASLGAMQNRFTSAVANLQTTAENLTASRSRIQDADFAAETGALTRAQILQQAGTAMLAQANSVPNNVLTLLR